MVLFVAIRETSVLSTYSSMAVSHFPKSALLALIGIIVAVTSDPPPQVRSYSLRMKTIANTLMVFAQFFSAEARFHTRHKPSWTKQHRNAYKSSNIFIIRRFPANITSKQRKIIVFSSTSKGVSSPAFISFL